MISVSHSDKQYAEKSVWLVVIFIILKIILSYFLNVGNDESYYISFAQRLQINYFDHPPMVAVWLKFFTANLALQHHLFFIRLGSLVGCALGSFFIYKTVYTISTAKAAFIAAFLYNISFYAAITAGLFIFPDTPQMVFWTGAMFFITQILKDDKKMFLWVLFAVFAGLSIMSKIHAVFLWGGVFLYALFYKRSWFSNKGFYIAAVITAVIVSPILIWNIQNNFITFRFHGERVEVNENSGFNAMGLLREVVGQLIINNPFTVGMIIFLFSKKYSSNTNAALRVFKLMGIPLLLVIFFISMFRTSLPHWSGPAYISLLPIAAIGLSEISIARFKIFYRSAFAYTILLMTAIAVAVNFYPGTFSNEAGVAFGKNDISLDAYGWKEGGEKFAAIYKARNANGKSPMVCNTWWGAHDEYYFARPLDIKMIGLGPVLDIHHFAWRLKYDTVNIKMDTAYAIVHSYDYFDAKKAFAKYYSKVDSIATIPILRNKKPAYNFYVYELTIKRNENLHKKFSTKEFK